MGEFVRTNTLPPFVREQLIGSALVSAAVVALPALGYMKLRGQRAGAALNRLARLLSPIMLIGLLPPLLHFEIWTDALVAVLAIAVFTVLFEVLLRRSLRVHDEMGSFVGVRFSLKPRRARWLAATVALLGAGLYAYYMSKYTLYAHRRFQTYNYDLGQYDNVFWNALHGHPLRCTPLGATGDWSSFSSHADLGVFFLLPFYAIRPNAETLLIMQATILGLGAVPLYLFSRRRLPPSYACTVAICYLLYAPLHGSNFYDFHFQPVAATAVLSVIWLIDTRRWIWAAFAFLFALSCREDISVGLTMLGIFYVLTEYRPVPGAVMALAGTVYFVFIRFYVMPHFGQGWFSDIYKDLYPNPGSHSFAGVIQTLMTNPVYVFRTLLTGEKLRYFLQIVTPVAFLPMRRTYLLASLAPGTLFTLLTTAYGPTTDIAFQYSGHFTPYIFAASAVALAAYRRGPEPRVMARAALLALCMGTLLCTLHWGVFPPRGPIRGGFGQVSFAAPSAAELQKERDLAELAAMIPSDAKFGVSEEELPHVSGRLNVMAMKYGHGDADYLLYGTTSNGSSVGSQALASSEYVEVATRPGLMLLKRKDR
jgi:uncharacterized membrane protein